MVGHGLDRGSSRMKKVEIAIMKMVDKLTRETEDDF